MDSSTVEKKSALNAQDLESPLIQNVREHVRPLLICLSKSWGGLEQVAAADALDTGAVFKGGEAPVHLPQILVLAGSPIHEHLAHRPEVRVVPLEYRPRDLLDFRLRHDLDSLMDAGVNLVHVHQPTLLASIVPWVWRKRNVGLITSRHIMSKHQKRDLFHRLLYSRVDALLAMSQMLKRNILETHAMKERKIRVVNLGLDFELFDPDRVNADTQRAKWGADSDTLVIGLVGRIDPAKGQATFIRAAASLIKGKRAGEKFKFVIVGEETLGSTKGYVDELQAMVKQFHLEDSVVFAGYQENIPEVMRALDLFVMPSKQEAFGLVAIEAMAMECPIVISRGGSAEEIVGQEEFGLTCRPEDAFDLQTKLRALIDQPLKRMEMGRKAREHVQKHYDRRRRLLSHLELYAEVAEKRRRLRV